MRDLIALMDAQTILSLGGPESVVYRAGDGYRSTVSGIFDAAYQRPTTGEAGAVSSTPAFFCTLDQLSTDPETDIGATLEVDGVGYEIREPQKDGQGAVLMYLHLL